MVIDGIVNDQDNEDNEDNDEQRRSCVSVVLPAKESRMAGC